MIKNSKVLKFDRPMEYYLDQGMSFIKEGNYLKALKNFLTACQKEPSKIPPFIHLSIAYQKMDLFDASNSALYKILASHPTNEGAFALLGQNYSLMGDHLRELFYLKNFSELTDDQDLMQLFENAPMLFNRYEQVYPLTKEMRDALNSRGQKLVQDGHFKVAMECFNEVLESFPDDVTAKNQMCQIFIEQQKFAQAIDLATEVIRFDADNVEGLCNLATALYLAGQKSQSTDAMCRAMQIAQEKHNLEDEEETRQLCKLFCNTNMFAYALTCAKALLKNHPYDIDFLTIAGVSAFNVKEYNLAKDYFMLLNNIFPDTELLRYHLGLVQDALDGKQDLPQMSFMLNLPAEEEYRITKAIYDMDFAKLWDNDEYERYVSWAFNNENLVLTEFILDGLYNADCKKTKKILKNLLAQEYGWQFKAIVLWKYLQHYPKRNIYANKNGYFVPLDMPKGKLPKNDPQPFWKAFAVLSVLFIEDDDWLEKLQQTAILVDEKYELLKQTDFSLDEIAGVIVRLAKFTNVGDEQVCAMFRVTYNRLGKITALISGD